MPAATRFNGQISGAAHGPAAGSLGGDGFGCFTAANVEGARNRGKADLPGDGRAGLRSFVCFRFLLGPGESPNWPAATKTAAEWFPKHERAWRKCVQLLLQFLLNADHSGK